MIWLRANWRRLARWAAVAYLIGGIVATLVLRWTDEWDVATLIAFAPRWLALVPGAALLAVGWVDRWTGIWSLAGFLVVLFGFSGFQVGMPMSPIERTPLRLRVVTFNTEVGRGLGAEFLAWMGPSPADVILTQECSADALERLGLSPAYESAAGIGGIGILSRFPIVSSESFDEPGYVHGGGATAFTVLTSAGPVVLVNVHLPTPRPGLEAMRHRPANAWSELAAVNELRSRRSAAMAAWVRRLPGPKVVAGDFNATPESAYWRRDWFDYRDAFAAVGLGWGATKFTKLTTARIDYILADETWSIRDCQVGPDVNSDHRPVAARLELKR